MKVKIYTDGGCFPNPGLGSFAYIVLDESETEIIRQSVKVDVETTNNRMEYKALIEAVKTCHVDDDIELFTDSMLLVNTFNKWIVSWERRQWVRKKRAGEIKNLDLVKDIFEIKRSYQGLKVFWIKGHSGHKWNDAVDEMCSNATTTYEVGNERDDD